MTALAELRQRRLHDCRLTPDRALQTLDEAEAFLADRGMLTLTQDSALPSLFAASHEEPYKRGAAGFGSWPKTKYVWAFQLTERPGVVGLKVHRGKMLLCGADATRAIDPLARAALAEADAAADERSRLVRHLRSAGPSQLDDVKSELGLPPAALRKVRERLESVAAVVSRDIEVPDRKGGHKHTSELRRWDQVWNKPWRATAEAALAELVLMGVRAAVLAHQDEVSKWFSWPVEWPLLASLISARRLDRPGPGWLAMP
ncbi:MAG: hypothetical protein E6J13_08115 [Chloroflexi bacterium]|nr:MAG: hypothetical protein E6J13_08115 [Chloroflexota bacterium]